MERSRFVIFTCNMVRFLQFEDVPIEPSMLVHHKQDKFVLYWVPFQLLLGGILQI